MNSPLKTQVGIIGAGPAGLLLSQLLNNAGIQTINIDRQSQRHIEGRVRAGVLEMGSVEILREAGVGDRMDEEGLLHSGFDLAFGHELHRIDLEGLVGKKVMVYGQTELTKDLFEARLNQGGHFVFNAENAQISDIDTDHPSIQYEKDGEVWTIECDYVAGCDGFRGVARQSIPSEILKTFERVYPFGWLGILTERPPVSDELIYANHERGFALCSMRSNTRSRYYLQCSNADRIEDWPDERFWDELEQRIGADVSSNLQRGPSFEKSMVPLRSFVAEPMRFGNLFLAGDAAHIVPPTGAKGLNLAIADVRILSHALIEKYSKNNSSFLESYSETCLSRVWKVERFSWYLSNLMHQLPENSPFEKRMQRAEFDYIVQSESASRTIAENYVGLPLGI